MIRTADLATDLARVRENAPLVHNITNYVAMNVTANALLALGASPVMAHATEEIEEITAIASALVLNIGTLDASWIASMEKAGAAARSLAKPVVLDPVGAGASRLRTHTAARLLAEARPVIVRGNASEILVLAGAAVSTKGVDSTASSDSSLEAAARLAREAECVVVVSGPNDYVTDGTRTLRLGGGHPLMPRITGMGCQATSLIGALAAVNPAPFEAAAHAMACMAVAGEMAAERAQGPGTFQAHFLDALHNLSEDDLAQRLEAEDMETPGP
jgi:hydroxyethylthiazole kinase